MTTDLLAQCAGFDWDEGNQEKNWLRHHVSVAECEQVFFHEPLLIASDPRHSKAEERWAAWGRSLATTWGLR